MYGGLGALKMKGTYIHAYTVKDKNQSCEHKLHLVT